MTTGALLALISLAKRAAVAVPDMTKAPPVRQKAKTARDLRRAKLTPAAFAAGRRA